MAQLRFDAGYFGDRYGDEFDAWATYALRREIAPHVAHLSGGRAEPRLLDLGCGLGRTLELLREATPAAIGCDVSFHALHIARGRGNRVANASVSDLPFQDGSLDGILMRDVLDLVPEVEVDRALAEAHRVLAPGGRIVITVMNMAHPHARASFGDDPFHCTPFDPSKLRQAGVRAGFEAYVRTEHTLAGVPGVGMLARAPHGQGVAYRAARLHAGITNRKLHAVLYGDKRQ